MDAQLVEHSSPLFDNLMRWTHQALGASIARVADERKLKGVEKYASCLSELGADPYRHIHLSFQIVCEDVDVLAILQAAGLPFIARDTIRRGIIYALISGTVAQWRDAVNAGLKKESTSEIYLKIKGQIQAVGLDPWKPAQSRIEHKK